MKTVLLCALGWIAVIAFAAAVVALAGAPQP